MRAIAKASSAGSTSGRGKSLGLFGIACLCVLGLIAFLGSGASAASAAVPAKGVTGFFGAKGIAAGQMETPRGVAVNQASGNVYAVDSTNNRIVVFDSNGKFIRAFGQDVVQNGSPDDNGTGYEICVPANGDVCKNAPPTNPTPPATGGAMNAPQGVVVNQSTGNVYITEQGNLRVQQFDSNGNFLRAFGRGVVARGPDNLPGTAEVQSITVKATSGTFRLSFEPFFNSGQATTAPIAFNAPASGSGSVEEALNALSNIGGAGASVSVTGGPGDATGSNPYVVTFGGALSGNNVSQISINTRNLGVAAGTLLSCSSSTASTTKNFQWLRNGAPIGGATSSTYTTAVADAGASIQCQVFSLNAGAGATQISTPQIVASPAPVMPPPSAPISIAAPTLAGSLAVPSTPSEVKLTCAPGEWGGEPSFAYQWYRNGIPLSGNGANTSVYTVQSADLSTAAVFQCAVTGTNAGGSVTRVSQSKATSPAPSPAAPGGNTASPEVETTYSASTTGTITQGIAVFEDCSAAAGDICQNGFSGSAGGEFKETFNGQIAVAPVGAPNAGDVLVADPGNSRVQEFSSTGAFVRTFGFDVETGGVTTFEVCTIAASCKAGTTGNESGQFAASTPTRVAEDAAGNIYTVEPTTNFRVQKFTLPANAPTPQGSFDEADLKGTAATSAPTDVAVDPATNNLLVAKGFVAGATASCPITGVPSVAESRVLEVSSAGSGSLEGTHGTCTAITPVNGLAVRGSGGNVFLSSTFSGQRLYVLNTGQPVLPTASITNVSEIGAHAATLSALINPNGPELPYGLETTYRVEYKRSTDPSFTKLSGSEASVGNRTTSQLVSVKLNGLQAATSYDVRLVATKLFGSGSVTTSTVSFVTNGSAPGVTVPAYIAVATTTARLEGTVNPNGSATGYHFEYVDDPSFQADGFDNATKVPTSDAGAGSGGVAVTVAKAIAGLEPNTTYHLRLIATNTSGPTASPDETFTTGRDNASCPNAAIRSEQASTVAPIGSTGLPDCMAFEQVAPSKKFSQPAKYPEFSANGERVQFQSLGALAETENQGSILDQYVSTRTASGWVTKPTAPPPATGFGSVITGGPCSYTPDLSRWVSFGFSRQENNLAANTARQGDLSGAYNQIGPRLFGIGAGINVTAGKCEGADAGASRIFFTFAGGQNSKGVTVFPGDPVPQSPSTTPPRNVYLSYLDENGTPTAKLLQRDNTGKVYGGSCGSAVGDIVGQSRARRGTVSADGSRVFFTDRPSQPEGVNCDEQANKLRIMRWQDSPSGPQITQVDTSECTRVSPPCDASDGDDLYRGASQEGNDVYFLSSRQLANSDLDTGSECSLTIGGAAGCDLYLYDASRAPGARLTQVSVGDGTDPSPGKGAEVLGVLDLAGNGSHVYFVATGVLTTNPNSLGRVAEASKPNLYMWERDAAHPAGRTAFIGTLNSGDETWKHVPGGGEPGEAFAVPILGTDKEDQSIGGDGHILVFQTKEALTPDDTDGAKEDLYRYESDTGSLERISKAAPGGSDSGAFDAKGVGGTNTEANTNPGAQALSFNRWVSEDGRTIAFKTQEALDPSDTDGTPSSYIWRDGQVAVIPASKENLNPQVSMSGEEIAFITYAKLAASDTDGALDPYVARIDGGFPAVVPHVPCEGEACQGPAGVQPGTEGSASATFNGPGNVAEAPKSGKRQRKHQKRRKHRKHRHQNKQAAHERGGQK